MSNNSELSDLIKQIQDINIKLEQKMDKATEDAVLNALNTNNLVVGSLGNIVELLDLVSQSKHGRMSKEDKKKLDEIEQGANKYIHPPTHPAPMIVEDEDHLFVTTDEKAKWNETTVVFEATKNALNKADSDVIREYFVSNPDPQPKDKDIFIVNTVLADITYEKSSYYYEKDNWVAITGCVDASKVIMRKDVIGAGKWEQIGNYKKGLNETKSFKAKGVSVVDFINDMMSKREQPVITAQPAVSGFALNGAAAVEAGTVISTAQFGTARLSPGSYTYKPATGVVASSYQVDRICSPSNLSKNIVATAASGTDNNGGAGFIIGDDTSVGNNVVSMLKYKVTVEHNQGAIALDNLDGNSNPIVRIEAGKKYQETGSYTPFRKYFYGTSADKPVIDSTYVRKLTHSTAAYRAQTLTVNVPRGTLRVAIACISNVKGVTRVINETALNADITEVFKKSVVKVAGINNYAPKDYNVWVFEPAVPFENTAVLKVTLG